MEVDPTLPGHTVYRPTDLDAVTKLPVVVWGEGMCLLPGKTYRELLSRIASHGYLVIAGLEPDETGLDTPGVMTRSIDWAIAENTRPGSKYRGKVATDAIGTAGHSCGGLIALHVGSVDPRVTSVLAMNSGIFDGGSLGGAVKSDVSRLTSPTMWLNTGPLDLAYKNAVSDFAAVPAGVPAVFANYDLSERGPGSTGAHLGTTVEPGGGEEGRAALLWFDATLEASRAALLQLLPPTCGLCANPKWTVEAKNWPETDRRT